MNIPQQLLERLNAIGLSVNTTGQALALLGLGSVGVETDRLDEYSDLDFFAIVKPGCKNQFLNDLDWLGSICPLAYYFRNTVDGYKLLFADGIFCEFAVFEPHELSHIAFSEGRIIWKAEGFDDTICTPSLRTPTENPTNSIEWFLGEALTNLYIGLGRFHRGEKLSACRFIQTYAVDRVIDLTHSLETAQADHQDSFNESRRYERRYPTSAQQLSTFMQGYDRNIESALAILSYLEGHFEVNAAIREAIISLCEQ